MARTKSNEPKPASDAYTGMLAISLIALIVGCVLLYLDYNQYGAAPPPPIPSAPAPPGQQPAPIPQPGVPPGQPPMQPGVDPNAVQPMPNAPPMMN